MVASGFSADKWMTVLAKCGAAEKGEKYEKLSIRNFDVVDSMRLAGITNFKLSFSEMQHTSKDRLSWQRQVTWD
ncbi:MAG TPA: hypothetical protein VKS20_04910 [Candidatus Acidoferrales bacterium]|nr:hypothetical protein [Candidatus Acidoferrales bacterium]